MMRGHGWHAFSPRQRVIGIVGGLGPYAHLEFERLLLGMVDSPSSDQDYPAWVLSSIPQTPDRTAALLEGGASPVPWLVRSLEFLTCHSDFAVITCVTAHAFLEEVRCQVRLPVLDLAEAALREVSRRFGAAGQVGILATTGTLRSGIFTRTGARVVPGLKLISLLDLTDGDRLQQDLVMQPIYGRSHEGGRRVGGIKSGNERDPETGVSYRETLATAVGLLMAAGVVCVIAGCTEISLVLGREPINGLPLVDPLEVGARNAVRIARGELPLP
jgi:aspartate racemase